MKTDIRFPIAGMMLLLALAGCGRGFFQWGERAPWRHEAEIACLKSGAVQLGAGVVQIEPIEGPGMCGADFPLKVAALGQYNPSLSYADNMRPPAAIASVSPSGMPQRPRNESGYEPSMVRPLESRPLPSQPVQNGSMRWVTGSSGIERSQAVTAAGRPLSLKPTDVAVDAAATRGTAAPQVRAGYNEPVYRGPALQSDVPPALGSSSGTPMAANAPVVLNPAAKLACPMVSALDRWVSEGVQPAALRWFGTPVVMVQQISAYSCRAMVGSGSSTISEHAFGNALDIAGFTFADGRKITVQDGWHGTPEEQGFLHDVQLYACETFTTVLAPGYNVHHHNHIHVDLMRRASGRKPCRPEAISGEVAAAQARAQYVGLRRGSTYAAPMNAHGFKPMRDARAGEDDDLEDDHGG